MKASGRSRRRNDEFPCRRRHRDGLQRRRRELPVPRAAKSAFIAGDEDFAQVIPAARDIKKGDACASPSSLILFAFRQQLVPLLVYVFLCFVDHPVVAFEHVGESTLLFQEFLNRELFRSLCSASRRLRFQRGYTQVSLPGGRSRDPGVSYRQPRGQGASTLRKQGPSV